MPGAAGVHPSSDCSKLGDEDKYHQERGKLRGLQETQMEVSDEGHSEGSFIFTIYRDRVTSLRKYELLAITNLFGFVFFPLVQPCKTQSCKIPPPPKAKVSS